MESNKEFKRKLKKGLKTGLKGIVAGLIIGITADHNGCMDSYRTEQARYFLSNPENPIKTIASVEEKWKNNSPLEFFSSATGGVGYNPLIIRTVTFEDQSQTKLRYRTLAWQPFRKWISGEDFNPQIGERYEVDSHNRIVRKVE